MGNSEVVSGLFRAIDAQQWQVVERAFTADVVYHRPGFSAIKGWDALLRFYLSERPVAVGRHTVCKILTGDGEGFCWGTFTGESRTGGELEESFADWYAFRGGRIAERRTFFYRPAI
jgi:uncharacterized protein